MSGNPGDGPRSLTSALHERLRADILATRLLPGQKLHIAGLAKTFSVSLAAVREALSRLVADGLVQASDQRGFRVSPGVARRSRRRDTDPDRHRGSRAAPFDRAGR
ncbi:GntR family transcriptional regulator [Bradyrhizobium liaoningense]